MMRGLQFWAERAMYGWGVNLHAIIKGENHTDVAQPVVMTRVDPAERMPDPMLHLDNDQAQQLMDELWRCGLRPTEGTGSAGSLAATERHLADMRRLVFDPPGKAPGTA